MPSIPSRNDAISDWMKQSLSADQQPLAVVDTTTETDIKNGKVSFAVTYTTPWIPPVGFVNLSFTNFPPQKPTMHAGHSSKNDARTCCTCNARTAKGGAGYVLKAKRTRRRFACSLDCARTVLVEWELKHGDAS